MKKTLFIVTMMVVIFVSVFSVGEIFLRIFYPQKTYSILKELVGEQYVEGGFIPFTLKAGYTAKQESQQYKGRFVTVRTNSKGLRSPEITYEKPKGIKRVLVLGDSYTFGVFVDNWETYPAQLEEKFRKEGKEIEVINAGYADGMDPDQMYAWLNNVGFKYEPDLVVYGFFVGNDIPRSGAIRDGWKKLDERGLPTEIVNNDIFVDKDGTLRSKNNDEKTVGLKRVYRIPLLRESHLFVLLWDRIGRVLNPGQKIVRVNAGWGRDPFPYILKACSSEEMKDGEKVFNEIVLGMKDSCEKRGVGFMVLMIPVSFQVNAAFLDKVMQGEGHEVRRDIFEEFNSEWDRAGVRHLNLLEKMKGSGDKYFFRSGDVHFSPEGHKFTAEQLKKYIEQNELLSEEERLEGKNDQRSY